MTAPQSFTRRSARVEAMRLDGHSLKRAAAWLQAHGLSTHITTGLALIAWDDVDALITAHLGDWIALNPDTGEFTVWDDEQFRAAHSEVAGVAQ